MEPAEIVYRRGRYDFDRSLIPTDDPPRQVTRWGMVAELARGKHSVVELNEPLLVALWPQLLSHVAVLRLRSLLTRRRATVAAYCIDNGDPAVEIARRRFVPTWLAPVLTRLCVRFLVSGIDRLAFGTEASARLYTRWAGEKLVTSRGRIFAALPAPCTCPEIDVAPDRGLQFLFVGAFAERKGIRQLMAAWDVLERTSDQPASLRLIGRGALLDVVRAWAADRPSVVLAIDPPRADIHQALRTTDVLALFSQSEPHWREQIGLPILEGLAHGAEVVTTDETGIAGWLRSHGHRVVAGSAPPQEMAAALLAAARDRRPRSQILADLPRVDGRLTADTWLMTGEDPTGSGQGIAPQRPG
jgi:glycosyltransferase involved in cell wall biosynthesis